MNSTIARVTALLVLCVAIGIAIVSLAAWRDERSMHEFGTREDCPAEDSCRPVYDESGWHIVPEEDQ